MGYLALADDGTVVCLVPSIQLQRLVALDKELVTYELGSNRDEL
jgi:hypothetical protein